MRSSEVEHYPLMARRFIAASLLRVLFPARVTDDYGGLVEAGNFVAQKHGLVLLPNHITLRDGPGVFIYVAAQNRHLIDKDWEAPVAWHIAKKAEALNRALHTGIDIKPVVTPSTKKKPEYAHLHRGQGLREYMEGAVEVLREGGIVALFPQATRSQYHEPPGPDDIALKMLMKRTSEAGVDDFGILPVGFRLPDPLDYETASGLNFFRTYQVNIGRLWRKSEVLTSAAQSNVSVDMWAYDQHTLLAPPCESGFPRSAVVFESGD